MRRVFLATLLLFSITTTVKADVVAGKADKKANEAVSILKKKLPSYLFTDRVIQIISHEKEIIPGRPEVVGMYQSILGIIHVRQDRNGRDFEEDVLHEYGHFIAQDIMKDEEVETFKSIWALLCEFAYNRDEYRTSDPQEAFCEAFSYYYSGNKELQHSIENGFIKKFLARLAQSAVSKFSKTGDHFELTGAYCFTSGHGSHSECWCAGNWGRESRKIRGNVSANVRHIPR